MRCNSMDRSARKRLQKHYLRRCRHTVSPALTMLFATLTTEDACCPECLINRIGMTLTEVRDGIGERGGIFTSKKLNRSDHHELVDKWRFASVQGLKVMQLLEDFLQGGDLEDEDRKLAEAALEKWTKLRGEVIPGIKVASEAGEEASAFAKFLEEEEQNWKGEENCDETAVLYCQLIKLWVEKLLREVEDEDRLAEMGKDPIKHLPKPAEEDTQAARGIALPEQTATKGAGSPTPKPSLKRTRSDTDSEPPRKRIKIEDHAAIFPPCPPSSAHPFAHILAEPKVMVHSPNAFRDTCRARNVLKRGSAGYKPGRWTAPKGRELQNTSWYRVSWGKMENEMEKGRLEWGRQCAENRRTKGRLKAIAQKWVEMRADRKKHENDRDCKRV